MVQEENRRVLGYASGGPRRPRARRSLVAAWWATWLALSLLYTGTVALLHVGLPVARRSLAMLPSSAERVYAATRDVTWLSLGGVALFGVACWMMARSDRTREAGWMPLLLFAVAAHAVFLLWVATWVASAAAY